MRDDDILDKSPPYFALAIAAVILVLGLTWLVQGNNFFLARVFSAKEEQTRRETFEKSKAYNEGTAQELRRMQSEYIRASSPEQKAALASVILHQTADYDEARLPPDLRVFLHDLRQGAR